MISLSLWPNWNNKASNIKAISEQLNLGLDSFVFIDDNPVERDLVRKALPMVEVPELSDNPFNWINEINDAHYFETLNFTADDVRRAEMYSDEARRKGDKN